MDEQVKDVMGFEELSYYDSQIKRYIQLQISDVQDKISAVLEHIGEDTYILDGDNHSV